MRPNLRLVDSSRVPEETELERMEIRRQTCLRRAEIFDKTEALYRRLALDERDEAKRIAEQMEVLK